MNIQTKIFSPSDAPTATLSCELPSTMRAAVYDASAAQSGPYVAEVSIPSRHRGQLLIHVAAASLTPQIRRRHFDEIKAASWLGNPALPGYGIAGHVIACDSDSRYQVGDRIMACANHVCGVVCTEFAVCQTDQSAKIPDAMPTDQAATLPLAGSMALQAIRDHAKVASGDRVLINGASGGIGAIAIQLAKHRDAHVTAVASAVNEPFCLDLGADEFISYQDINFTWEGTRWDVIFDVAGTTSFHEVLDVLKENGRYVSTHPSATEMLVTWFAWLFSKYGTAMLVKPNASDLDELIHLYELGKLRLPIDSRFPMHQIADADHRFEEGLVRGKIILFNES